MRYVTYSLEDQTIIYASAGPVESHVSNLQHGQGVGDLGELGADFAPDDALVNYRFCPKHPTECSQVAVGHVDLKPEHERDQAQSEIFRTQQRNSIRFHQLALSEISFLTIHLNIPLRFDLLEGEEEVIPINFDEAELDVLIRKKESAETHSFDFGGKLYPFTYSEISFSFSPHLSFIKSEVENFLREKDQGFSVFTSMVLQAASLKASLRVTNKVIDAYRIAYADSAVMPIGFANILNSALIITLHDGAKTHYMTGSPYQDAVLRSKLHPQELTPQESRKQEMHELLKRKTVPFLLAAISSLKSAHLYGQYRECVIWAATIISNVLEDFLLNALLDDSAEKKALKNKGSEIRGKERRTKFFSAATGKTLAEYLQSIINNYEGSHVQDHYWKDLPRHVENVLQTRNLMLHRKKGIAPIEADDAFYTCMNFVFAMGGGVPYSTLYSRDYNLKLLDALL